MRRHARTALVVAVAGGLLVPAGPSEAQYRLYLQARDTQTGGMVGDLRPEEILVLEDGRARTVVDVRPANLPLKLAVVVDNSQGTRVAWDRVQEGVAALLDAIPPHQDMSLLTVAPGPDWLVQSEFDRDAVVEHLGRIESTNGPPRFLDALVEAAEWLETDTWPSRPVLVVVSGDGPDASRELERRFATLTDLVRRHGITVHSVVMRSPRPGSLRRRLSGQEAIGRDLQGLTGGLHTPVVLGANLTEPLGAVATRLGERGRELAGQLLVQYERPDDQAPERVEVRVTRLGARVSVTTDGRLP